MQGPAVLQNQSVLINFGSNDYLGLAADPRLARSAKDAIDQYGFGSGASPLITGRSAAQEALEEQLAQFKNTESAITFSSGFAANAGTVAALADRGDIIFSDAKNHASIIDGTRASRATVRVYPHGDVDYLDNLLNQSQNFRRRLIVTDSLFSMDGDFAPLAELVQLAETHQAMLMVDEAHATGVCGEHGRGVCELFGLEAQVPIRVGTFSKALGGHGGFVVGSRPLIDWLLNRARPFVFSTAAPAANFAAMQTALDIVGEEPFRRRELAELADHLRAELRSQGWQLGASESHIVPVIVGTEAYVTELSGRLAEKGMLVPGIRPPTVPDGECLLRISLCYGHTRQHVSDLVMALDAFRQR